MTFFFFCIMTRFSYRCCIVPSLHWQRQATVFLLVGHLQVILNCDRGAEQEEKKRFSFSDPLFLSPGRCQQATSWQRSYRASQFTASHCNLTPWRLRSTTQTTSATAQTKRSPKTAPWPEPWTSVPAKVSSWDDRPCRIVTACYLVSSSLTKAFWMTFTLLFDAQ